MVFWRFPFNEVVWIANSKGGLLFSATLARESGSHSLASSSTVHEILTKFNFVTACFIWDLFPSRFLETMRDFKHSGINLLHYFSYCDFNRLFFRFCPYFTGSWHLPWQPKDPFDQGQFGISSQWGDSICHLVESVSLFQHQRRWRWLLLWISANHWLLWTQRVCGSMALQNVEWSQT